MALNSCLYVTRITHVRLTPRFHRFAYRFFSFYLDLDELDALGRQISGLGRNRFNWYSFYDRDYTKAAAVSVKNHIVSYLEKHSVNWDGGRIMLLTNLRMLGYVFNPVSFYFCFDRQGQPVCVVPAIGNTFGELKMFMMDHAHCREGRFSDRKDKFYYISPFTRLDDQLEFSLTVPGKRLAVAVDTCRQGEKIVAATMIGERRPLTSDHLFRLTAAVPFVTLKIIALIHWHALLLWLKRVPYQNKDNHMHLQKEIHYVPSHARER